MTFQRLREPVLGDNADRLVKLLEDPAAEYSRWIGGREPSLEDYALQLELPLGDTGEVVH